MNLTRRWMGLLLPLLLLGGIWLLLRTPAAPLADRAAADPSQATRTVRPTVLHPTRRPSEIATFTPFVPHAATATAATANRIPSLPPPVRDLSTDGLPFTEALPFTEVRLSTEAPPSPEAPPSTEAPPLPASARVEGITGHHQSLPLSCESRSAVDWAAFFGTQIGELTFFNALPTSIDPELGFVGSPYGGWGQIPPYAYGVHAAPVADLLRSYGLPASATRNMPLTAALAEVAAGRPVIVWVTGHVEAGSGVEVQINDQIRRVARYEHTVILIGYDDDLDIVTFLDGERVYNRLIDTFLRAWEPLENMAVVFDDQ